MKVSVVIPTLNEAGILESTLARVQKYVPHEIIITDGGSDDKTLEIAKKAGVRVISSSRGRASQMNAGVSVATGNLLWFLHADSVVEPEGYQSMIQVMADNGHIGGAFTLKIDSPKSSLRFISSFATIRAKVFGLAYGDQGIFVRADTFRRIGGYPLVPICEDLELFRRLWKEGKVVILKSSVLTSARRWQAEGVVYVTLRNILIASFFILGFPPDLLSRWYSVVR